MKTSEMIGLDKPLADPAYFQPDPTTVDLAHLHHVYIRASDLIHRGMDYDKAMKMAEEEWEDNE